MTCEMCGSENGLTKALVEGVELTVCNNCAAFGKKVPRINKNISRVSRGYTTPRKPEREIIQVVMPNFSTIIRQKREKMGLKQMELAKYLAERESLIHKMESGSITPSLELARKLEKQLSIVLVETKEIKSQDLKIDSKKLTIGDLIKQKLGK
jgi:uncharacterized protein (TIGR00270 family)